MGDTQLDTCVLKNIVDEFTRKKFNEEFYRMVKPFANNFDVLTILRDGNTIRIESLPNADNSKIVGLKVDLLMFLSKLNKVLNEFARTFGIELTSFEMKEDGQNIIIYKTIINKKQ